METLWKAMWLKYPKCATLFSSEKQVIHARHSINVSDKFIAVS